MDVFLIAITYIFTLSHLTSVWSSIKFMTGNISNWRHILSIIYRPGFTCLQYTHPYKHTYVCLLFAGEIFEMNAHAFRSKMIWEKDNWGQIWILKEITKRKIFIFSLFGCFQFFFLFLPDASTSLGYFAALAIFIHLMHSQNNKKMALGNDFVIQW